MARQTFTGSRISRWHRSCHPLLGEQGAAAVFAPQKGDTPDDNQPGGKSGMLCSYGSGLSDRSWDRGAGAAGELGYAFLQFWMRKQRSGS